jgi:hypothetical protein
MKTAQEWFRILPPDIRREAESIMIPRLKNKKCHSLHEAITRSLDWWKGGSKGHKYWKQLRNDIRDGKAEFGTEWYQIF